MEISGWILSQNDSIQELLLPDETDRSLLRLTVWEPFAFEGPD
jgi:hypothetical protein